MKKKITTLVSLIFCLCVITINVSAISLSEKEDIYRADSFLYKNSIDKNVTINWLLNDNNFIYPKQAKISNESFWESFLRNSLKNIDNATALASGNFSILFEDNEEYRKALKEIMLSFMETSNNKDDGAINEIRQQERQEYYYGLITNAYSFCKASSDYSSLTTSMTSQTLEELCYKTRNGDFEVFENEFVMMFKTADEQTKARAMFDDYMDSAVFSNYLKGFTEFAGYTTEILNIAKYSSDVFVELKTYNRLDQEFIEFLRYLYTTSNSQDIIAVSGELLTKLTVSTETCKKNAITQIATKIASAGSDLISSKLIDLAFDHLGPVNVLSAVNLGVAAGNIVSDYWFSTSKTEEIITSIFACDELSKVLSKSVSAKLSSYENYFGDYEGQAKKAKELIYHTKLLWQTRYYGENLFYKFKITAYSADMMAFSYLFGDAAEDVEKIESWYGFQTSELNLAYNILFSAIDKAYYEDLYEYPEETEDFVIVDGKLIAYNGSSSSPCVPYDVHTIGTEAFNGETLMTQLTIRGTTMETHSVTKCGDLYSLFIPKSVTNIANEAIYNCPNVTIYGYTGTAAEAYAKNNNIPFYSLGSAVSDNGMYVSGDYTLSSGTLNLDGQTMYVGGNFLHTGGTLNIGSGKLVIFGDYNISSYYKQAANGMVLTYSGNLNMSHENGNMIVYGTFLCQSLYNNLTAGTIEINGHFVQQTSTYTGSGYRYNNFSPSGTHKVILSGTGEQNISFQNPGESYFNILEIKNTSGLLNFAPLSVNGEIIGDITSNYDISINGSNITLKNQKIVSPNIHIEGESDITISGNVNMIGNLHNTYGSLFIEGQLNLKGNYVSVSKYLSPYNGTSGYLCMESNNAYMIVHHNFETSSAYNTLKAGTLEIKGDFSQHTGINSNAYGVYDNFKAMDSHKVILSGLGKQIITFEKPDKSYFNILINKNPAGVVFATAYRYNELQTIYPFDFDVAEYNEETNQIQVDVILSEALQSLNGHVIITLFDDSNKLIECRTRELSALEPQVFSGATDYEGTYTVKVFYWMDTTSINPLCPSIQKELSTK